MIGRTIDLYKTGSMSVVIYSKDLFTIMIELCLLFVQLLMFVDGVLVVCPFKCQDL